MFTLSATILAIVVTVATTLGFAGGYTISNWRTAAQVAKLEDNNVFLTEANARCKTDIASVRQSVTAIEQAADEKVKQAQIEAVKTQPKADTHTSKAITVIAAPVRKDETQCAAVEREQLEYLQWRRKS